LQKRSVQKTSTAVELGEVAKAKHCVDLVADKPYNQQKKSTSIEEKGTSENAGNPVGNPTKNTQKKRGSANSFNAQGLP